MSYPQIKTRKNCDFVKFAQDKIKPQPHKRRTIMCIDTLCEKQHDVHISTLKIAVYLRTNKVLWSNLMKKLRYISNLFPSCLRLFFVQACRQHRSLHEYPLSSQHSCKKVQFHELAAFPWMISTFQIPPEDPLCCRQLNKAFLQVQD